MEDCQKINNFVTAEEAEFVPLVCPVCKNLLMWDVSHTELICDNDDCGNVTTSRFISWIQTIGVRDMLGIGPAILKEFVFNYESCINKQATVEDLYDDLAGFENNIVLKEKFLNMFTPAIKEKLKQVINNLYQPIEKDKILYAMNIRGLGVTICEKISDIVFTAFNLNNAEQQDDELNKISQIDGIGLDAQNRVKNARNIISRLFYLVPCLQTNLAGKIERIAKITVTGSVSIPRKQFDLLCAKNGIELSENIKDSDYLVTNNPNSGSSKIQKANKLGIKIITEEEFYDLYKINKN